MHQLKLYALESIVCTCELSFSRFTMFNVEQKAFTVTANLPLYNTLFLVMAARNMSSKSLELLLHQTIVIQQRASAKAHVFVVAPSYLNSSKSRSYIGHPFSLYCFKKAIKFTVISSEIQSHLANEYDEFAQL